jgi:branched-chain amino acid transport system permease protein
LPDPAPGGGRSTLPARLGGAAVLLGLVVLGLLLPPLRIGMADDVLAFAVAVLGVNLIVGHAGQISLGHGAFVGLGAYTTVILSADHGWPLLATVPAAAAVAFVVGVLVGLPALRMRGLYLALLTLGLAGTFGPLVKRLDAITNGTNGKGSSAELVAPSWAGGTRAADARWKYFTILAVAVVAFALARNVVSGRVGRALAAIRENELSATTFGVPVARFKVAAFGVSAAIAAVAGSMFMLQQPFATEARFSPDLSIKLYTAAFIGGIGTLGGPFVGGVVIVAVPFLIEKLGIHLDEGLLYGSALVALTLFAPDGLVGQFRQHRRG